MFTDNGEPPRFSVVVPVYSNEATLPTLLGRLQDAAHQLEGPVELVFVVDGSPDDSESRLRELLPTGGLDSQLLVLSRNFGSFSAIRVGLQHARGQYVSVIAADLQEPPELIIDFFETLEAGEVDIVVGRRTGRQDPTRTKVASSLYWRLYRRVVNPDVPAGGVDVFACSRQVVDELNRFREAHTSLVGLLFWLGYRRGSVDYERHERPTGRSGWTFRKKARYLFDSIYAFTDLPIALLQMVGAVGMAISVVIGAVTLLSWFLGVISVPGYTPLILVIVLSTSALLLGLGVVGSYVWRNYENGKERPIAVVRSRREYPGLQGERNFE